ncbi:hypothetical protein LMED105_07083 [Limnobacter sp. MED105]|nr:hypothetical protein LMED105_07083 [Limnobacter sp. MED105]
MSVLLAGLKVNQFNASLMSLGSLQQ